MGPAYPPTLFALHSPPPPPPPSRERWRWCVTGIGRPGCCAIWPPGAGEERAYRSCTMRYGPTGGPGTPEPSEPGGGQLLLSSATLLSWRAQAVQWPPGSAETSIPSPVPRRGRSTCTPSAPGETQEISGLYDMFMKHRASRSLGFRWRFYPGSPETQPRDSKSTEVCLIARRPRAGRVKSYEDSPPTGGAEPDRSRRFVLGAPIRLVRTVLRSF